MQRLYTLIILLSAVTVMNAQQWEVISKPYTTSSLQDIFFVNENSGWAVGNDGFIMHTANGGVTWEEQSSGTSKDIAKVFFLDEQNGWAGTGQNSSATSGGTILRTTDGGNVWVEISYAGVIPNILFTYCDKIVFVNSLTGFMVCGKSKSNYLLKTTDGGLTWSKKDSLINASTALRWYDMNFYNESKGVVVGNAKNIQKYTTDGGETWNFSTPIADNFFKDLRTVKYLSENEVITVGDGQEINGVPTPIYKSLDGGINWVKKTQTPTNSYNRARGIYFKNSLEGIVAGSNGSSFPFLYKTTDGGETWTPSVPNAGFSLAAISGSGNTLYAIGNSSMVIKSTDFGDNWSFYSAKTPASVYDIQFLNGKGYAALSNGSVIGCSDTENEEWSYLAETGLCAAGSLVFTDENTGYILKDNRSIKKTTDGGLSWVSKLDPIDFNTRNRAGDISFGDVNTGYAWMSINDYAEYHIFKTTNAGDSWNEIQNIAGPNYLTGGMHFFDKDNGFIAGPDMWLQYTSDGGSTWNAAIVNNLPSDYSGTDLEEICIDGNNVWSVGDNVILKSTDKGLSWNYYGIDISLTDSAFTTVAFYNDTLGYITTDWGLVIKTSDGGITWSSDYIFYDTLMFHSSAFNEKGEFYLGSTNGRIVKWKTSTVGVEDEPAGVKRYTLEQNYPNPFNPSTTFSFDIAEQGRVTLKIYDVLGREAATVLDEDLISGSHSIKFNASELSSGIYFYTLKAGSFSYTAKMVLLK